MSSQTAILDWGQREEHPHHIHASNGTDIRQRIQCGLPQPGDRFSVLTVPWIPSRTIRGEVALTSREGTVKRTAHARRAQLLDRCMHRMVLVAQPGPTPCAPR